jgi:hypothetical protein
LPGRSRFSRRIRRDPARALGDPLRRRSPSCDKRRRQFWKVQLAEGQSLPSMDDQIPRQRNR